MESDTLGLKLNFYQFLPRGLDCVTYPHLVSLCRMGSNSTHLLSGGED